MFSVMPGVLGMEKILSSILLINKLFYLSNILPNKQWFIYIEIHRLFTLTGHSGFAFPLDFHCFPGLPCSVILIT